MLCLASCPMFEGLALDLADQLRRLWAFPQARVAVLLRAPDPPALPGEPVRLAHHEHGKLGLAAGFRLVVDEAQHLAQLAHLGPREMMAEEPENLGIADCLPRSRRRDQDRPDFLRVGEQSSFGHCGCWVKSTGVSSNTSSLDVLCGHGITSRHRNGPMRSRTPAMLRLGSSP